MRMDCDEETCNTATTNQALLHDGFCRNGRLCAVCSVFHSLSPESQFISCLETHANMQEQPVPNLFRVLDLRLAWQCCFAGARGSRMLCVCPVETQCASSLIHCFRYLSGLRCERTLNGSTSFHKDPHFF